MAISVVSPEVDSTTRLSNPPDAPVVDTDDVFIRVVYGKLNRENIPITPVNGVYDLTLRKPEDLVVDCIILGREFQQRHTNFKTWFKTEYAFIDALRGKFAKSGPKCKIGIPQEDGTERHLTWQQFVKENFHVTASYLNQLIASLRTSEDVEDDDDDNKGKGTGNGGKGNRGNSNPTIKAQLSNAVSSLESVRSDVVSLKDEFNSLYVVASEEKISKRLEVYLRQMKTRIDSLSARIDNRIASGIPVAEVAPKETEN